MSAIISWVLHKQIDQDLEGRTLGCSVFLGWVPRLPDSWTIMCSFHATLCIYFTAISCLLSTHLHLENILVSCRRRGTKIVEHFLFRGSIDSTCWGWGRSSLPPPPPSFPALPTLCPHLLLPPSYLLFLHLKKKFISIFFSCACKYFYWAFLTLTSKHSDRGSWVFLHEINSLRRDLKSYDLWVFFFLSVSLLSKMLHFW